jgi:hypothetical protein
VGIGERGDGDETVQLPERHARIAQRELQRLPATTKRQSLMRDFFLFRENLNQI